MRAIEIAGKGGSADALRLTERELVLAMGPDQVIIRVVAAGVNRADIMQRRGQYDPPEGVTDIPGLEVSGVVEAVGANVTRYKPGDYVCALLPGGGYAEYVVAHQALCHEVPPNMSVVDAAALPEALFTVWNNVFLRGRLRPGESLLIHGGTSGIGVMATQMAYQCGSQVYVTTGDAGKKRLCIKLGARMAIDRGLENYVEALRRVVPEGIDVVLDMSGGQVLTQDMDIMAPDGRHVSIAHMNGKTATIDIPTMMRKRLVLTGSTLRGRPLHELAAIGEDLDLKIWPMITNGRIKPVIAKTFPLEDAPAAHKYMESGKHQGKILLTVL